VFVNPTTWWLFAGTETVLCLTPGPAVLFVLSSALRSGTRMSLFSNLGILAANTVYFVLSAAGVGSLLLASHNLFFAVKWIGAAYLIFVGLRAMFGKTEVLSAAAPQKEKRPWRMFADGFILQASNPKAIVFFTALLPQFVDPRSPVAPQMAILAITSVAIEFCVLLGYGAAAGRASEIARQPRYAAWTNRVAGGLLICAGAGIATLRKT
jgi:threonine/homoserine/homoserine lactone efflux protein